MCGKPTKNNTDRHSRSHWAGGILNLTSWIRYLSELVARCPLRHLTSTGSCTDREGKILPGLSLSVQCAENNRPTVCQALASTLFLSNNDLLSSSSRGNHVEINCQLFRTLSIYRYKWGQYGTCLGQRRSAPLSVLLRYVGSVVRRMTLPSRPVSLPRTLRVVLPTELTCGRWLELWHSLPGNHIETNGIICLLCQS